MKIGAFQEREKKQRTDVPRPRPSNRHVREQPPKKKIDYKKYRRYWPVIVGVALILAALALVFGYRSEQQKTDVAQTQTGVAVAERDATAVQAKSLADQIKEACEDPSERNQVPEAACVKANEVSNNPIPAIPGPRGPQGDTGVSGVPGVAGAAGTPGTAGSKGDAGVAGPKGDKGDKGDTGDKGVAGDKGATGDKGEAGATGSKGSQGDAGAGISSLTFESDGNAGCVAVVTYTDGRVERPAVSPQVCTSQGLLN
jgi:hypothetical protein